MLWRALASDIALEPMCISLSCSMFMFGDYMGPVECASCQATRSKVKGRASDVLVRAYALLFRGDC